MALTPEWARQVVQALRADDRHDLFEDALACTSADNDGEVPPADPARLLEWLRFDEPGEVEDSNESPENYAGFLLTEWDLYGVSG
jgi:hypothetical protein